MGKAFVYIVDDEVFTDEKTANAYKTLVNLQLSFSGSCSSVYVKKTIIDKKGSFSMIVDDIKKMIKCWPKKSIETFLKKENLD